MLTTPFLVSLHWEYSEMPRRRPVFSVVNSCLTVGCDPFQRITTPCIGLGEAKVLRLADPWGASVKMFRVQGLRNGVHPLHLGTMVTTYYDSDMTKGSHQQRQTGYSSYGAYSGPIQNSTKQFANRNATSATQLLHNTHLGKGSFSAEGKAQAEGRKHIEQNAAQTLHR